MAETLFVLDECAAALANLPALSQALVLGRGSGIRLLMFWQTYEQAQAAFKDKPNLVGDNSDCQVFFGTNGLETAQRESQMLGPSTVVETSATENWSQSWASDPGGNGNQSNQTSGMTFAEKPRDLLQVSEVLTLSPEFAVCFIRGLRPLLLRRIKWFQEKALFGLSKPTFLIWWLLVAACVASLVWTIVGR